MTDHTWAQEQIPALIAGGLDPSETARLEAHAAECPTCASDLAAARDFDQQLAMLCAPARPTPGLEDRVVLAVRTARTRRKLLLTGWRRTVAAGVAASVGLGVLGAGAGHLVAEGRLPVPGGGTWARGALPVDINKVYARADGSISADDSNAILDPEWTAGRLGAQLWGEGEGRRGDKYLTNGVGGFDSTLRADLPGFSRQAGGVASTGEGQATKTPAESVLLPGHQNSAFSGRSGATQSRTLKEGGGAAPGSERGANQPPDSAHSYFGVMPTDWSDNGRYPGNGPAATTNGTTALGLGYSDLSNLGGGQQDRAGQVRVEGNTITGGRVGKPKFGRDAPPAPPGSDEGKSEKGKPDPQRTQLGRPDYDGLAAVERQPPVPDPAPGDPGAASRRVVIRSGEIEFEVDSFDATVAVVTKLVAGVKGGVVATVNSVRLQNGKMKGYVTVRVPPESLDGLVLDLRKEIAKTGELKGQKIGSQDITKQYIDLESRLKVAKAMETRILQIIKEGKGDIKVLLEAEKQLGEWRTKIEEMEGEIRHYAQQVALSSLTVLLVEKEIKAAAGLTENERVQAGVEVEDVETAYRELLKAVADAKGRVTKSEMKQLTAGQFSGTIHFEVAPEAAGPVRDRLRQLGRVARLEIDRVQQADSGTVQKDAKVHRGDTQFQVQLYNLANIAPRETAVVQVAVPDVPAAYLAVREAVTKASGRVLVAQLNEQDRQNITAQLDFDIRRTEDGALGAALTAAGEIVSRQITRAPEGDSVTDAKVLYRTAFVAASRLKPRETTTLAVEVPDVDAALIVLGSRVAEVHGRQVDTNVARERSGRVTAKVVYDVPFASATGLVDQLKLSGTVRVHQSARDPQAPDGKYATARIEVTLSNAEGIVGNDDGLWPPVRRGLSYSASVLLTSLTWVIVGLCVVLPWAIVGIGGYRLIRRFTRSRPAPVGGGSATV